MVSEKMSDSEFNRWTDHVDSVLEEFSNRQFGQRLVEQGVLELVEGVERLVAKRSAKFGSHPQIDYCAKLIRKQLLRPVHHRDLKKRRPGRPQLNSALAESILIGLVRAHKDGAMLRRIHRYLCPGGDLEFKLGKGNDLLVRAGMPAIPGDISDNENWAQELKRTCWRALSRRICSTSPAPLSVDQIKKKYMSKLRSRPIAGPKQLQDHHQAE